MFVLILLGRPDKNPQLRAKFRGGLIIIIIIITTTTTMRYNGQLSSCRPSVHIVTTLQPFTCLLTAARLNAIALFGAQYLYSTFING